MATNPNPNPNHKRVGTFTETGTSEPLNIQGPFSLNLNFGTSGTVDLERKEFTQADSEYVVVERYTEASALVVAGAALADEGDSGGEFTYRLNCTALVGDITYALARSTSGARR